jgi:hypothetical protein
MKNLQNVKFFQVGKSGWEWDGDKENFYHFITKIFENCGNCKCRKMKT